MEDPKDVPAEPSTATQEDAAQSAAESVTQPAGDDRPVKNVVAEFNRKFTKVERQQMEVTEKLNQISQLLLAQHQQAPTPRTTAAPGAETDEELWGKAQMGDRLAFEEYQRRIARREYQQANAQNTRQQIVGAQFTALMQRYPYLNNDSSHPLTQIAQQAYQSLLQLGYPAGQATLLEAAKTAIADRPDLIDNLPSHVREGARRNSASVAQAGQTGTTTRQDPAQPKNAVIIRPGEMEIARRMGIKDPKKAKERFLERQSKGQSALGAVSGFVREEDF